MMLPLVVVGCTSKQSAGSVREATTASGVDNAASPDWQTLAERDYFTLMREADHYAKTTGRELRLLMSSVDRVVGTMAPMQLL